MEIIDSFVLKAAMHENTKMQDLNLLQVHNCFLEKAVCWLGDQAPHVDIFQLKYFQYQHKGFCPDMWIHEGQWVRRNNWVH